jgi:hypothetical protein
MKLADSRSKARGKRRGGGLFPALALAGLLTVTTPWSDAAYASGSETSHGEAAGANGAPEGPPIFGLPPIVVDVLQIGDPDAKTIIFKADLVFDEVDQTRIEDTLIITKSLLPRIMDSVITGIQGKSFKNLKDIAFLNDLVLQRSNDVLRPYGVVVKSLRLRDLGRP